MDDGASDDGGSTVGPKGARAGSANYLFKYIMLLQVLVYLEAGAVPALLHEIKSAFALSFFEQGALCT